MLVAFIGNPCPQIDFSTTVTHIVQAFVKCFFLIIPNLLPTKLHPEEPGHFCLPTNIDLYIYR